MRSIQKDRLGRTDTHFPYTTLFRSGNRVLRQEYHDFQEIIGGNGGYQIRNSQQNKGYGTKALELMKDMFKKMGLSEILITCDDNNVASIKVIEKNDGLLKDKIVPEFAKENKLIRRYIIKH